jgi:hypothetical protein
MDRVFLLSVEEVVLYFGDSGQFAKQPFVWESEGFSDQYDEARIATTVDGKARAWWLRSAGDRPSYAAVIGHDGYFKDNGTATQGRYGVRPAMWLSLDGQAPPPMEQVPVSVTYVTKEKTYALDLPHGLVILGSGSNNPGDHLMLESLPGGWSMDFYEHVPMSNDSTFSAQKDIEASFNELIPIIIAGKDSYYYLDDSSRIYLSARFPNPVSDDRQAVFGSLAIRMEPIEGFSASDYINIPEIKAILESIRAPE